MSKNPVKCNVTGRKIINSNVLLRATPSQLGACFSAVVQITNIIFIKIGNQLIPPACQHSCCTGLMGTN